MGEIIEFNKGGNMNKDYVPFSKNSDYDYELARKIHNKVADIKVVNDPTRKQIAINLGEILDTYGRELNRGELIEKALGTTYIKPSERLSKFQIKPNTQISESKIRFLSHRLHDYIKISNAAADILGETQSKLLLKLFKNTKFVNDDGKDSIPSKPEVLISDLLNKAADLLIKKFELSDYFKTCELYNVVREIKKKGDENYNFVVNHDSYRYSGPPENSLIDSYVPLIRLTSVIRSTTKCKYISYYLNEKNILKKDIEKERFIASIENIIMGIIPSGKNYDPKLVMITYPSIALLRQSVKTKEKYKNTLTKNKYPIINTLSSKLFRIVPKEYGKIKQKQLELLKTLKNYKDLPFEEIIISQKDKLNLDWMKKYSVNNMKELLGKSCIYFPYRIVPLDKNSILDLLDVSKDQIFSSSYDALTKEYDTTRAISPPNSMLAQMEINLFFDGYHLTFDDSEDNIYKTMPEPNYDIDTDGNIIDLGDIEPSKFNYTVIELMEQEIKKSVNGLKDWRKKIEKEIRILAEEKIKQMDANINAFKK